MEKPFNMKNNIFLFAYSFMSIFCLSASADIHKNNDLNVSDHVPSKPPVSSTSFVVCNDNTIPYRSACQLLVSSMKHNQSSPVSVARDLFDHYVHFSFNHVSDFLGLSNGLSNSYMSTSPDKSMASSDCMELLEDTLDQLTNVINRKNKLFYTKTDVQTWLSTALTNQETCIDSLRNGEFNEAKEEIILLARNLSHHISNSLSLYVSHYMKQYEKKMDGRKMLSKNGFPHWVSRSDRKLLETPVGEIKADAVVAKDGSGTHMTITEAIETAAKTYMERSNGDGSEVKFIVRLKAGTYYENVKIKTKIKNVVLIGNGRDNTFIIADRNADDGWSTFQSATVAATGDGFMAKGITFINTAGPGKHQAVALRVGSDKSVIYQCSIQGYQDSLYAHSKRQFYRDCDIHGTVDFIFGNAAVIIQNCNIFARNSPYRNFITAQGRIDPNQNTGISIQSCKISGVSPQSTFLGRPWKQYSRTVVMQSYLDDSINPAGWYPWTGLFALDTLYYAEYMNSGPGSCTSGRVKWLGYRGNLTPADAEKFTVESFIQGNMWVPGTGVPFNSTLIG